MSGEVLASGRVGLHCGDCLQVLTTFAENSIDAIVTDPPYHLQSIHDRFAKKGRDETSERYAAGPYGRHVTGFMGRQWDGGDIAFRPETWAAVWRLLKPGAHMCVFGGTHTYHRMVCAIEDLGFEIRDTLAWLYATGFPKSHNVSKAIDRAAGAEREVVGKGRSGKRELFNGQNAGRSQDFLAGEYDYSVPATDVAREWSGWGTALKPAMELIVLARKPLSENTVAANVLRWGTGAINIDATRIPTDDKPSGSGTPPLRFSGDNHRPFHDDAEARGCNQSLLGRWPANLCHDGSDKVLAGFPDTGSSPPIGSMGGGSNKHGIYGDFAGVPHENGFGDSGSAARFFFCAKANVDDRIGSRHPTIKPVSLIQWLVRLITPPACTVLDMFAGTGTTGEAAIREGFRAVLIEREPDYCADIRRRMRLAMAGPEERRRASIKARGLVEGAGPLFE